MAADRRRWPVVVVGAGALLSLLVGALGAAALLAAGYGSEAADAAERAVRREGGTSVGRDRDLTQRPCRPFALVRPSDAVTVAGYAGPRRRLEVSVLAVPGAGRDVASRLAAGLRACGTADARPFTLAYRDVQARGADVDWRVDAAGPRATSGLARFRRLGSCSVYLTDQQIGTALPDPAALDRLEAVLRRTLAGRPPSGCTG